MYVDEVLCISHDPHILMKEIPLKFRLKKDKIAPPKIYLGTRLKDKRSNLLKYGLCF